MERLEDRTLLTTFTVNSLLDKIDTNPGDGAANDGLGNSTLRAAVMESNARFGQDTIVLGAGTYRLTIGGVDEDGAAKGDLDITDNLTIVGAGAGLTIIDANGLDRAFHLLSTGTLNISGVTIRGGSTSGDGGGILNEGRLGVTTSIVSNNTAGDRGGAIANLGETTLIDSTLRQNVANSDGGGVYNGDKLTVTRTTIADNTSNLRGGGIFNSLPSGGASQNLVITESTIRGNLAVTRGGGIYNADQLTVVNSTLSGNTAGSRGGGIFNTDSAVIDASTLSGNVSSSRGGGIFNDGILTLTTSTVSGNTVLPGTSPTPKQGGGIYNDATLTLRRTTVTANAAENGGGLFQLGGTATIANAIVAANSGTVADPDVAGTIVSAGNNFVGDVGTAAGLANGTNGDLVGGGANPVLNPQLGSLQNNGGPTQTHAPRPGSPVVDRGNTNNITVNDQRGLPRSVDGDRNGSAIPDIGSVEFQPTPDVIGPIGTITSLTPTFQWSAVPGAVRYDIWVNDQTTGQSGVIRDQNVMSTSFTPTTSLAAGHSYLWTVRAIFANDVPGDWAVHKSFFIQSNVGTPSVLTPGAVTTDDTPTFSWTPVAGATRYDLWVNNQTTGQSGVIREMNLTGTSFTPSTPLTRGNHYIWTVRAFNAGGVSGEWATHSKFKIELVEIPELQTPVGTTIDQTPRFEWSAIANAARYDIWVNNQTTGESGVIRDQNVIGTSYTPTVPLVVGNSYLWTVRAIDGAGTPGPFANHAQFSVVSAGAALPPVNVGPVSATIDSTPDFRWTKVTGAARYELQVINQTTGQTVISQSNITSESFTPTQALQPGISYRWRVRAYNENNAPTPFSNETIFTVTNPTAQPSPTLQSPVNVTTIDSTPTFRWTTVAGASHYDLWVNNTTTGESQVIRETLLATNSFTPTTPLVVGNSYVWTVRAVNDDATSTPFAPNATFKVGSPASGTPTLLNPQGSTIDATPTFEWSAVPGASRYELRVNDTTTGTNDVIHRTDLTTASFTPASSLTVGRNYTWTVQAFTDNGSATGFAAQKSFTISSPTSLGAPTLTAPISTASSTRPTFQWSAVNGAAGYDLWVNDQSTGQSGVIRERNLTGTSFTPTLALTPGHSYIWTVRAFNDSGQFGAFASHKTFAVTSSLAAPVAIAPSGSTSDTTPTFVWTVVSGAAKYDLWVNDLTTGQSGVIRNQNIQSTAYTNVLPLTRGHNYIWTVRAINSTGQVSNWSPHKTFRIASADSNLLLDGEGVPLKTLPGEGSSSPLPEELATPETRLVDSAMMLADAGIRPETQVAGVNDIPAIPGVGLETRALASTADLAEVAFATWDAAELWDQPSREDVVATSPVDSRPAGSPSAWAAIWPAGLVPAIRRLRRRRSQREE